MPSVRGQGRWYLPDYQVNMWFKCQRCFAGYCGHSIISYRLT